MTTTSEDTKKIIGPKGKIICFEDVLPMVARGERVYGYIDQGTYAKQIVGIKSEYYLEKYKTDIEFYWVSFTTIADLVTKR